MSNLAVIPARSGSKGLKDKNIKDLCGMPLMAHSIKAAIKSDIFDEIHVSTDSKEYADIAVAYGASVPFLRSKLHSSDIAGSWDVVKEVLSHYDKQGKEFDTVTLLQPTSPLRTAMDIKASLEIFQTKKAKAVVSVCECEHSPLWSNTLSDDLSMDAFVDARQGRQRQNLQTYYRINGAIYMVSTDFLLENDMIYRKGCYAYIMDRRRSIDIDTQLDFDMAEYFLKTK